jgi:hypothetical protein
MGKDDLDDDIKNKKINEGKRANFLWVDYR